MFTPLGLLQISWWAFTSSSGSSLITLLSPNFNILQICTGGKKKSSFPSFFKPGVLFLNREKKRIFLTGKEAMAEFRTETFLQHIPVKSNSLCSFGSALIHISRQNFTHPSSAELFHNTQRVRDSETSPFFISFYNLNALDLGLSCFLRRFTGRVC